MAIGARVYTRPGGLDGRERRGRNSEREHERKGLEGGEDGGERYRMEGKSRLF